MAAALLVGVNAGCNQREAPKPTDSVTPRAPQFPALLTPGPSTTATLAPAVTKPSNETPTAQPGGRFELPGQLLYVKDDQVWLWSRGDSTRLTVDARHTHPSWLPDGRSFLLTRWSQGFSDLYRYFLDGRPMEQLTRNDPIYGGKGAWAAQPAVAPDGRQVAFVSDRDTSVPALWTLDLVGKASRQVAPDPASPGGIQDPAWRPDGTGLAAVFTEHNITQVWTAPLATSRWGGVTRSGEGAYAPAWHPSGQWIAYTQRSGTTSDIWVSRPDGRDATQLTTDGMSRSPVWASDGSLLVLTSRRDNVFDLFAGRIDLTGAQPQLGLLQHLTRGANLDPAGGISWNPRTP